MSVPRYVSLVDKNLKLQDLLTQISAVLDQGLPTLKLTSSLQFQDQGTTVGGLRYDTSENAVQYTNDGGMTWNNLTSDTIEWRNNKAYAIGTVVLHGQAFYACVEEIEGPTYPEPGNTTAWRLLTIGSVCQIVKNAAQLKTALQLANQESITIYLAGPISSTIVADSITAPSITIWSDQNTALASSLTFVAPANTTIYWHAQGTKSTSNITISMTGGSLYIERMTAATATTLTLSGSVFYQRIDGTISGGTQTDWIQTSSTSFVPRDLSQLQSVSPDSSTLLYADAGLNGNGSITAQDLASMVAPLAAASFRVNMVDVLANKPLSADPGYVFYASDTGDLYIMGDDGETWGPAVHIQGGYGYTFTPAVDSAGNLTWTASIVPVTSGGPTPPTSVNIMGPQGSQGADGASAFDVWREATGSSSAQVSDYLQALGLGHRRTAFDASSVQNNTVSFSSDYPLIAIQDNEGRQWPIVANSVRYYNDTNCIADITNILEQKQLTQKAAFILVTGGIEYTRYSTGDQGVYYAWQNEMQAPRAILYTTTLTNLVGATLYTDTVTPTTADDLEILDAAAARTAQQITGTWYGIFSGGGGNDGDTGTVQIVSVSMLQPGATPTVTDISVPTFTGDDSGTVSVYERDAAHDVSGTSFAWLKHGTSTDYYTAVEAPIAGMPFYADSSLTTEQGAVLEYKSAALHPQYILGIPEPQSSSGGGGNSYAEVQLTTVDSANKASISGRIIPFCILRPSAAMQVIRSGDVTWSSAGSAVTTLIDMTYYLAEANIASFSSSQNWTCGYFTPAAD